MCELCPDDGTKWHGVPDTVLPLQQMSDAVIEAAWQAWNKAVQDEAGIVVRPSATRPTEHVLVFIDEWSLSVPWDEVPGLITKLRRAYNSRPIKGVR